MLRRSLVHLKNTWTITTTLSAIILFGAVVFTNSAANAQLTEDQKSHVLFDIRLDKMRTYATAQGVDFDQIVANLSEGAIQKEDVQNISRVYGTAQLPSDMEAGMQLFAPMMGRPVAEPKTWDDGSRKTWVEDPNSGSDKREYDGSDKREYDGSDKKSDRFNNISFRRQQSSYELPLNFFVRVECKDQQTARKFTEMQWPDPQPVEVGGKTLMGGANSNVPTNLFFHLPSATTFEIGTGDYLAMDTRRTFTERLGQAWGSMNDDALRVAIDLESVETMVTEVVGMSMEQISATLHEDLKLIPTISTIKLSMDFEAADLLSLVATCKDVNDAANVQASLDQKLNLAKLLAADLVRQAGAMDEKLGAVTGDILNSLSAKANDESVSIVIPRPADMDEALRNGLAKMQKQAVVVNRQNKLRQCVLSVHNYFDSYEKFPFTPASGMHENLSWRARISPYVEGPLINADQPFDSIDNALYANAMPDSFGEGTSESNIFWVDSGTPLDNFGAIRDGASNTIMLLELKRAAPWMQPGDIGLEEAVEIIAGLQEGETILAGYYDGSIHTIPAGVPKDTIRALLTPQGGEFVETEF